jgi:glyoxylase-like metal-dependent hydrolase (beta-lactamase superfamily II)
MAEAYGEIKPVPEEALIPHSACDIEGVTVIETPGHAPHHLSYVFKGHLFSGESAGVYLPHIAENYLRPPTPPRFILEIAVSSVDRMLELDDLPICFAHFGHHRSSHAMLENYRKQLFLWRDIIAEEAAKGDEDGLVERCAEKLLAKDAALAAFSSLDEASKKRETYFIENGVRGYLGYLKEQAGG